MVGIVVEAGGRPKSGWWRLLIEGARVMEIGLKPEMGYKTVEVYRASLMRKLDVQDIAGLSNFAVHAKLSPK